MCVYLTGGLQLGTSGGLKLGAGYCHEEFDVLYMSIIAGTTGGLQLGVSTAGGQKLGIGEYKKTRHHFCVISLSL